MILVEIGILGPAAGVQVALFVSWTTQVESVSQNNYEAWFRQKDLTTIRDYSVMFGHNDAKCRHDF